GGAQEEQRFEQGRFGGTRSAPCELGVHLGGQSEDFGSGFKYLHASVRVGDLLLEHGGTISGLSSVVILLGGFSAQFGRIQALGHHGFCHCALIQPQREGLGQNGGVPEQLVGSMCEALDGDQVGEFARSA